jgi:hypothetical protein
MPLRLTTPQWRLVLRWFVRGMSSAQIARETRLDRKRVLRALLVVRRRLSELAPSDLPLAPERDEDETLDVTQKDLTLTRTRMPVLAIYESHGQFWGKVVSEREAARIARAVRERGPERLESAGDGPYSAIVYRRRLYRLSEGERGSSTPFGQIEAFWSYLQRQLRSKGGIRRSRLNLYLAEYAWRYNHRKMSPDAQVRELMLLVRAPRGVRNDAFPRLSSSSFRHAAH